MSPIRLTVLLLSVTGLLGACAAVEIGGDFEPARFQSDTRIGITTMGEVKALMGEPASRGKRTDADGAVFDKWVYYYGTGMPPQFADVSFKMLEVYFDNKGRVSAFSWSSSE